MGLVFLPVGVPLLEGVAGSEFGAALAGGGDTDGDGATELLVGAPAGDAAFLYEAADGAMGDTAVVSWTGATSGDRFGEVLIFADLDGDGVDEVVVAAPVPGAVSVFEGRAEAAATKLEGELPGDEFGSALAAGDLDADGYVGLVVGAPGVGAELGAVYVFGGASTGVATTASGEWEGTDDGDAFGTSVAAGFDFDGDGYGDMAVGSPGAGGGAGSAAVFLGSTGGPEEGADWTGTHASGWNVGSLLTAGDFDGDGDGDLAIGGDPLFSSAAWWVPGDPSVSGVATEMPLEYAYLDTYNGVWLGSGADLDGDGDDDLPYASWGVGGPADCDCQSLYVAGVAMGSVAGPDETVVARVSAPEAVAILGDLDGNGLREMAFGDLDNARTSVRPAVTDVDGDGGHADHGGRLSDCDDADAAVYVGASEVDADGIDHDCDGADDRPTSTHLTTCPTFANLPEAKVWADAPDSAIWNPLDVLDEIEAVVLAAPCEAEESAVSGSCENSSARTATCATAEDGLEGGYAYLYVQEERFWEDGIECESSYELDVTTVADVDLATATSRGVVGATFNRSGINWVADESTGVIRWSDGSISSFSAWEEDYDYTTEWGDYSYSVTARDVEVDGCSVAISASAESGDYYERTWEVSMGTDTVTVTAPPYAACGRPLPREGADFAVAWHNDVPSPVDLATWEPYLGSGTDADGDLWPEDYDCDDADATVHPCAVEIDGDLLDNDCDGVLAGESDLDGDGTIDEFDCAPENPAAEVLVDVFEDLDGDGYGGAVAGTACEIPEGLATNDSDVHAA